MNFKEMSIKKKLYLVTLVGGGIVSELPPTFLEILKFRSLQQ